MNDESHPASHEHHHGVHVWPAIRPHSHDDQIDAALESSADGMRALWISLAGLGLTAATQAAVVALSGSVALLGDTLHNCADALTAVPLGVGRRLMDSVDPALTEQAEQTLRATPGVLDAGQIRLRWVGRTLRAECEISVDPACSVVQAHAVAVSAEHRLIHAIPRLVAATVHADPADGTDHHALLADHAA
jgi:divalent metal cation (Fe/Co/Zn/Cd) transporter